MIALDCASQVKDCTRDAARLDFDFCLPPSRLRSGLTANQPILAWKTDGPPPFQTRPIYASLSRQGHDTERGSREGHSTSVGLLHARQYGTPGADRVAAQQPAQATSDQAHEASDLAQARSVYGNTDWPAAGQLQGRTYEVPISSWAPEMMVAGEGRGGGARHNDNANPSVTQGGAVGHNGTPMANIPYLGLTLDTEHRAAGGSRESGGEASPDSRYSDNRARSGETVTSVRDSDVKPGVGEPWMPRTHALRKIIGEIGIEVPALQKASASPSNDSEFADIDEISLVGRVTGDSDEQAPQNGRRIVLL